MIRAVIVGLLTLGSLVNLLMMVLHHGIGTSLFDSMCLALLTAGMSLNGLYRLWVRRA